MDLKVYLWSKGLTMNAFSKKIGVSRTTVSNYIFRKRKPSLDIAFRIEKVTDGLVSAQNLMEYYNETAS